jgi:hypothetical protein
VKDPPPRSEGAAGIWDSYLGSRGSGSTFQVLDSEAADAGLVHSLVFPFLGSGGVLWAMPPSPRVGVGVSISRFGV